MCVRGKSENYIDQQSGVFEVSTALYYIHPRRVTLLALFAGRQVYTRGKGGLIVYTHTYTRGPKWSRSLNIPIAFISFRLYVYVYDYCRAERARATAHF